MTSCGARCSLGAFAILALATSAGAETRAAASAAAETVAAAPEAAAFQTPVSTPTTAPVPADSGRWSAFLRRYRPQDNLVEVGAFLGGVFISDQNSFRGPIVYNPGASPTVKPFSTFGQPALELGVRGGYFPLAFLGGELEGMLAMAETDTDDTVTVLAARAQLVVQAPYWRIVPFVVAGAGYWSVHNDVSGNDSDPAFHFGGGVKLAVTENISARLDLRDSVTNGRPEGSFPHHFETLAGASWVFGRAPEGPRDADRDNVIDDRDQCPLEAGSSPNGCPSRDSDSDGVLDADDRCVTEVGVAPTGCPVRDADQDGVLDERDQCVGELGVAPTGCPDADMDGFLDRADHCPNVAGVAPDGCQQDNDGDGLLGADDLCPDRAESKNGFDDADGCPDELPAEVQNFAGVLTGVEFDSDQAVLREASWSVLQRAVEILTRYPGLRVEIVGHTDDRGAREHNVELSRRRADAVKEHLVSRGIDAGRIESRGEGPDAPLATNDTEEGRQKNRRIELRVIQ